PDVDGDRALVDRIAAGNLRALLALGDGGLDRTGNVEARSWLMLAGAVGEVAPDVVAIEPSWHHTYAIAAWTRLAAADDPGAAARPEPPPRHYPMPGPARLALHDALYALPRHRAAPA